jgi:methylated-DNA-[protein]-cysteine S-methyltransferase
MTSAQNYFKNVYVEKFRKIGYITLWTHKGYIVKVSFDKNVKCGSLKVSSETVVKDFFYTVEKYLEGDYVKFDFPHKFYKVSEFSEKVYEELKKIPYGKVVSYKTIACKIGKPNAYRAVGNVCGKNKIPLIVPCHRVIRKNGNLGGFSGGISIKKMFLEIEKIKGVTYDGFKH